MKTLEQFWDAIGMDETVRRAAAAAERETDAAKVQPACELLLHEGTAKEGYRRLREALGDDPDGMKMLACMARCALRTWEAYETRGIPLHIFSETMRFLTRFTRADSAKCGRPVFRWGWWFYRQLSLCESRIGALEYEMAQTEEFGRCLFLHIPAGADLSLPSLRASVREAQTFFAAHFPAYADAEMYCESWMLSPQLDALLPEGAAILRFKNCFTTLRHDADSRAALDWIFPDGSVPTEDLPETTSLQRRVKVLLLAGGSVGWTLGKLKKDALFS